MPSSTSSCRAGSPGTTWRSGESIYGSLQEAFAGIGTPYAAPPASPSPALPLRAYAGTYANDYVGRVEVVEREGAPALLMGPGKRPYPLRHFDRDVFTQEAYPEPPAPRAGVAFAVGPDGTAHSVALEYFNDSGQGALTRVSPGRLGSRRTAAC